MSSNVLHVVVRRPGLSRCGWFHVAALCICLFARTAATGERTCGSEFDDVGSSALLAPIVVEGRAKRVLYETGEQLPDSAARPSSGVSVLFDRLRLYKGQLVESWDQVRAIEVGYFGSTADREACVAPLPNTDRSYVLFLRHNDSRTTERGREYRLSAFPVLNSRRTTATVLEFTNCSRCGRTTYCMTMCRQFVIFSRLIA